jgi:hypothetical protein
MVGCNELMFNCCQPDSTRARCVFDYVCRCAIKLARYLKYPVPSSADASKLVVSLESVSRRLGSYSQGTRVRFLAHIARVR